MMQVFKYSLLITACCLLFTTIASTQTPDWDSVYNHYLNKYQPTDTPAWLFPMVFEEAGGQRDTIFIGYDSLASKFIGSAETQFGEKWEVPGVDFPDSSFQALLYYKNLNNDSLDSILSVDVRGSLESGFEINFGYGTLPLKIWWDVRRFRSDSLPFPDQDPAPRAQGEIQWNGPPMYTGCCSYQDGVLISDTAGSVKDSIVFIPESGCSPCGIGPLYFEVTRWTGKRTGISKYLANATNFKVYPNPAQYLLYIQSINGKGFNYQLADLTDKVYKSGSAVEQQQKVALNMNTLPASGVYLLHITTQNQTYTRKIIVYED